MFTSHRAAHAFLILTIAMRIAPAAAADGPGPPEAGAGDTLYLPDASSFYIRGHVSRPGQYILASDMVVAQAIATAGGLTPEAASNRIRIIRPSDGRSIRLRADMTDEIQPDDVVVVERRIF